MQHISWPSDAELFAEIGRDLAAAAGSSELARLTLVAVARIPGAEFAGVTRGVDNGFVTIGATDEVVDLADRIQYDVGSGPCVDAVTDDTAFIVDDLATDERWPTFSRRAVEATGIRSLLSIRLFVEDAADVVAALNLYARQPSAFDVGSHRMGLILATHGGLALATTMARERIVDLEHALESSREIGVAVGILMARHRVTRGQAFDLLRVAGQQAHRKVAEVAADVVARGDLPQPRPITPR